MKSIHSYLPPDPNGSGPENCSPGSKPVRKLRGCLSWLENVFIYLGVLCILAMGVLITTSVVMRTLGNSSVTDEVTIIGELMIGALILPLAFVAAERGFISVEIFTQKLGPGFQHALNLLAAIVGLLAVTPITYAAYVTMVEAYTSGGYFFGMLQLPKWPGATAFFAGYFLFFLRLIDLTVTDLLCSLGVIKPRPDQSSEEL
ncbi:TRAP transporter small permease [Marinobacter caseinilyticus]|uniref:TRAP transporter small permease n=1 Tax=Marinobacter caseinilyticus TaxID=2692195 RepID=UPI0014084DDD|nr:TRAP transporter small permease [Marinobacter caseinilyticus]